ncbi:IclR family transcriptional regulator [Micromonospora sp. SL4-19]|uniref:IclR family transcriptional regulator n=1 Tax=Micromonospora sp. SL4-19 TaxID=3399129 RepID=UPI003A4E4748
MVAAEPDYIVKPVFKALAVLRCIGEADRPLTLGDVCSRAELPKSTAFKYLRTLRDSGFVAHDPDTDTYRIGLVVWQLGQLSGEQNRIREVALPAMRRLHGRFGETVNLGLPDGRDIVYLEMIESTRALRMQARLGSRDPLYSTALGKAYLAALDGDAWRNLVPTRLAPRTHHTVASLAALRAELDQARARGYATETGENEEGSACVAAAIHDARGVPVAAISVSAPDRRMDDELRAEIGRHVAAAAADCSQRLGYRTAL